MLKSKETILMQEYEDGWGFNGLVFGTREECVKAAWKIHCAETTEVKYGRMLEWDLSLALKEKLNSINTRIRNYIKRKK